MRHLVMGLLFTALWTLWLVFDHSKLDLVFDAVGMWLAGAMVSSGLAMVMLQAKKG